MKVKEIVYCASWVVLLAAAVGKMFFPAVAPYVYLCAAAVLAVAQFQCRVRGGNHTLRRLVVQQQIGGLVLVLSGGLMFTHTRNEWIVAMFIGALFELYTAYRIPQELEKRK